MRSCAGSSPARGANIFGGIAQLVERLLCKQRVAGSNPVASTSQTECKPVVRRPALGAGRREFESLHSDQIYREGARAVKRHCLENRGALACATRVRISSFPPVLRQRKTGLAGPTPPRRGAKRAVGVWVAPGRKIAATRGQRCFGEVPERLNGAAWKADARSNAAPGFESPSLRQCKPV